MRLVKCYKISTNTCLNILLLRTFLPRHRVTINKTRIEIKVNETNIPTRQEYTHEVIISRFILLHGGNRCDVISANKIEYALWFLSTYCIKLYIFILSSLFYRFYQALSAGSAQHGTRDSPVVYVPPVYIPPQFSATVSCHRLFNTKPNVQ